MPEKRQKKKKKRWNKIKRRLRLPVTSTPPSRYPDRSLTNGRRPIAWNSKFTCRTQNIESERPYRGPPSPCARVVRRDHTTTRIQKPPPPPFFFYRSTKTAANNCERDEWFSGFSSSRLGRTMGIRYRAAAAATVGKSLLPGSSRVPREARCGRPYVLARDPFAAAAVSLA